MSMRVFAVSKIGSKFARGLAIPRLQTKFHFSITRKTLTRGITKIASSRDLGFCFYKWLILHD